MKAMFREFMRHSFFVLTAFIVSQSVFANVEWTQMTTPGEKEAQVITRHVFSRIDKNQLKMSSQVTVVSIYSPKPITRSRIVSQDELVKELESLKGKKGRRFSADEIDTFISQIDAEKPTTYQSFSGIGGLINRNNKINLLEQCEIYFLRHGK